MNQEGPNIRNCYKKMEKPKAYRITDIKNQIQYTWIDMGNELFKR